MLALALAGLHTLPATAQQAGTVTGTVVDAATSRPLESAQVFVPALTRGTLTNADGRFVILNLPAGSHEIRVQLIGYGEGTRSVDVSAGAATAVEFRLESTALRLQELVVTGVAAAMPRVKLPFTVERMDFTEMPVPAPSAEGLITGKVPGARVVRGSGQPGSQASILLRGPTTITGSQSPLVIVDGVITDNTLADIGSLDVESIEVVKGAAGASLYGSRAQNGVVQIRTRRGAALAQDESRLTVRNEYGRSQLEGSVAMSWAHPWATDAQGNILDEAGRVVDIRHFYRSDGLAQGRYVVCTPGQTLGDTTCAPPNPALNGGVPAKTFQDSPYPYPTYDQVERFFDPGAFYSGYVAAEGRTASTNYRASFTHQHESGVLDLNDGSTLNGFRLNLDHRVRDDLDVSLSTYYARSRREDIGPAPFQGLVFMAPHVDLLARDPTTAGRYPCGPQGCFNRSPDPLALGGNPLYRLEVEDIQDTRQRFLASARVNFAPTSWFALEAQVSVDQSDFFETDVTPSGLVVNQGVTRGDLSKTSFHDNDLNASVTASLNRSFGDLTTRTRVRYLLEDQHSESFNVLGDDFAAQAVPDFSNITGFFIAGSSVRDVIAEGFFFVTALDYQGKYISDFLVRRDGSSLFGAQERWHTYYRASGAWRMAQERWWPLDDVNEFKLRYSIGTAGGRPGFAWQYETYSVDQGVLRPTALGNAALKPELSTEQELGLEVVLFNRVNTGVTYAWSEVQDQLLQVPLPGFVGFNSQWRNAGTLESNTLEAFAEMALIDGPAFGWTSRVNFDRTRQEITRLDVDPYRQGWQHVREGEELGTFYGRRLATRCADLPSGTDCGAFAVNSDGLLVYVGAGNTAGDGIAKDLWGTTGEVDGRSYGWGIPIAAQNADGNDFLFIGNTTPDFNLSWSNTLRWGSLSLYALLDGEFGADIYNFTRQRAYRDDRSGDVDQLGKPDSEKKPLGYYQSLYGVGSQASWFVEDGTFVKIREASLRYTVDRGTVEKLFGGLGIDGLSVNLIGRNLLTFSDYSGYDPEVGSSDIDNGAGAQSEAIARVDTFQYPNFRSFTAALEIVF